MATPLVNTLRPLLEPTIASMGYELVAVEWITGGRRGTLRISLDKMVADEEGRFGVSASDCSRVSHRVSALLDAEDPITGAYQLEVGSPGMDRPLQREQDFVRFKGFRVRLRLEAGMPRRRYTGTLVGMADGDVLVDVDGQEHALSLESIERAQLVLTMEEYATLGKGLPPLPLSYTARSTTHVPSDVVDASQEVSHDHK